MKFATPTPASLLFAMALVASAGCASEDAEDALTGDMTRPSGAVEPANPGEAADTLSGEDHAPGQSDAGAAQDVPPPGPTELPLHPPGAAHRTWLALGDQLAAWVERTAPQEAPTLMLWHLDRHETPPTSLPIPHLRAPRELTLDGGHLAYVDTIYGDDDVFVTEVDTGHTTLVAGGPGVQRAPHLRHGHLTWVDCAGCPAGSPPGGEEIFLLDLSQGLGSAPVSITDDLVQDRAPTLGRDGAGQIIVAWVSGLDVVRYSPISDLTDVATIESVGVHSLTLTDGVLAARPSAGILNPDSMMPIILNPDSMIPSDPFRVDLVSGEALPLTVHAELRGDQSPRIATAAGRVAWLQGEPGTESGARIQIVSASTGGDVLTIEAPGLQTVALGAHHAGATGPTTDGSEESDVWLWTLPSDDDMETP